MRQAVEDEPPQPHDRALLLLSVRRRLRCGRGCCCGGRRRSCRRGCSCSCSRGGSDETEGPLVDVVRLRVGHVLDFGSVHLGQAAEEVEVRVTLGVDFVGLREVILSPLFLLLPLLLPPPPPLRALGLGRQGDRAR